MSRVPGLGYGFGTQQQISTANVLAGQLKANTNRNRNLRIYGGYTDTTINRNTMLTNEIVASLEANLEIEIKAR